MSSGEGVWAIMFHIFDSAMRDAASSQQQPPSSHQPGMSENKSTPRRIISSRSFRACKRCQIYRIKCGEKPCKACRLSNVECTEGNRPVTTSMSIKSARSVSKRSTMPLDINSAASKTSAISHAPGDNPSDVNRPLTEHSTRSWSSSTTGFDSMGLSPGPCTPSTLDRLQRFKLLLHGVSGNVAPHMSAVLPQDTSELSSAGGNQAVGAELLNRDKQAYFVRLYWTSWAPLFPLMADPEFESLFTANWTDLFERQTVEGAMIDGMTALGIQCGHATAGGGRILGCDPKTARRCSMECFKRCQDRIRREGSRISVNAIRCYALMALYELQANRVEAAYYMVGLGVRRAHMSRLHLAPAAHVPAQEAIGRIRTWWLLYWSDVHCSMQLGLPTAVQRSAVTCPPQPPNPATDGALGDESHSPGNYPFFLSKLAVAIGEALDAAPVIQFLDDVDSLSTLEEAAGRLYQHMRRLAALFASLPEYLVNCREGASSAATSPLSTEPASGYDVPENAPVSLILGTPDWLQRQRIVLELHYHHACILLQRPYILRSQNPEAVTGEPSSSGLIRYHADQAVQHACSILSMLYSIYFRSDVLDGLTMVFQCIWNAITTIAAQIFVQTDGPRKADLSNTLTNALMMLESLSRTNSEALHVYQVSRSLITNLRDGDAASRTNPNLGRPSPLGPLPNVNTDPSVSTPLDFVAVSDEVMNVALSGWSDCDSFINHDFRMACDDTGSANWDGTECF